MDDTKPFRNVLKECRLLTRSIFTATTKTGRFLKVKISSQWRNIENNPLSYKWNMAIRTLQQIDFDAVVLLGSDDYIDEAFLKYVERTIPDFDMIGFKDIYFQHEGGLYYWSGYTNNRRGEPCGAGKVYSRRISWNV
jgi:hypothetical protein